MKKKNKVDDSKHFIKIARDQKMLKMLRKKNKEENIEAVKKIYKKMFHHKKRNYSQEEAFEMMVITNQSAYRRGFDHGLNTASVILNKKKVI
jgi:hypothetical protein